MPDASPLLSPQSNGSKVASVNSNRPRYQSVDSYLTSADVSDNDNSRLLQSPQWSAFHADSSDFQHDEFNSPADSDAFGISKDSAPSTPLSNYSGRSTDQPMSPYRSGGETQKLTPIYQPRLSPNDEPTPGLISIAISPTSSVGSNTTKTSNRSRSSTYGGADSAIMEGIDEYKSEFDTIRERGAHKRALYLLDLAVIGKIHSSTPSDESQGITAKQAANIAYERKLKEKAMMKKKLEEDREKFRKQLAGSNLQRLVPPKEMMTETTRKIKPPSATDIRDPETVAGMKCQYDIDRENEAKRRALKMLDYTSELD